MELLNYMITTTGAPVTMINQDYCHGCGEGGPLLCCDYCPVSYHLICLDPPLYEVPDGTWACKKCKATVSFSFCKSYQRL